MEQPVMTVKGLSIGRPLVTIALKAFYDGIGSSSNPDTPAVTLAGYAAPPEVWDAFDASWPEMLKGDGSRPACPYLHMADLMAAFRPNDRDNPYRDWSVADCRQLLQDVYRFLYDKAWNRENHFRGLVCTVVRDDLYKALRVIPDLDLSPEAICTDHVVMWAVQMLPKASDGKTGLVQLIFDRNEPFKATLATRLAPKRSQQSELMRRIGPVVEAISEETPALQAADYLAWNTNRSRTASDASGVAANAYRLLSSRIHEAFYGYEQLIATYRGGWTRD